MDATHEEWRAYRACNGIDPDVFFPHTTADEKHAKAICSGCTVREECLTYALTRREDHGVWGGLTDRERRSLIRRQRRQRFRMSLEVNATT